MPSYLSGETIYKELEIILLALHPNSTFILQLADLSAFRPINEKINDS
jgi:hypothetical protein